MPVTGLPKASLVKSPLRIDEEKCLVVADRSPDRTPKLVQIELRGRSVKVALCVEVGVADEFEERSMEIVRAPFGCNQNRGPRACAKLGRVGVSQNLEFLNVVDRGEHPDPPRR